MWVAEVSSPITRVHDLVRRRRVYEQAGVGEYWFVELDAERVEVHRLDGDRYGPPTVIGRGGTVAAAALPDLRVTVDDLLA